MSLQEINEQELEVKLDDNKYFNIEEIRRLNNKFKRQLDKNKLKEGSNNYNQIKKYFEKFYAKIYDPNIFYHVRTMRVLSETNLKHDMSNVFYSVVNLNDKDKLLYLMMAGDVSILDIIGKFFNEILMTHT